MPSARNKKQRKPVTDSLPSEVQNNRASLRAGDICVGCIVWLPEQLLNDQSLQCIQSNCGEVLDVRGYNHPVVVLSIRQNEISKVSGDLITSIALVNC
jgi:hypothetical protein